MVLALVLAANFLRRTQKPEHLQAIDPAAFAATANPEPIDPSDLVPNRIVVDFEDGTTKAEFDEWEKSWSIDLELATQGEGRDSAITIANYNGTPEERAALLTRIRQHKHVEAAEPLFAYRAFAFVPNDPRYPEQWNLPLVGMPEAWTKTRGEGVTVAVLDTGILQVPDLAGTKFAKGYNFVDDNEDTTDDNGHGTHVAGTIAQTTDNRLGVAGIAPAATLLPIKVLDSSGAGQSAAIADGIRWAADHGARVLNLSLGGGARSEVIELAIRYAYEKGAVIVCAAGNTGRGKVEFPAAYPLAIAVGAVGPDGSRARYSAYGSDLDLVAPGGDKSKGDEGGILQASIPNGGDAKETYLALQGTSMAAPHVAGAAALLIAAGAKTPEEVETALYAGALPKGRGVGDEQYGHGLLQVDRSLSAFANGVAKPVARTSTRSSWMLLWPAAFLAFVLLSIPKRERPTFFSVLAVPSFLIPLVLVSGVFSVQWFNDIPILRWMQVPFLEWVALRVFSRALIPTGILFSALIPFFFALLAFIRPRLRPIASGVSTGYATALAATIWFSEPPLDWLLHSYIAIPWLMLQFVLCLLIARTTLLQKASP